jgi:hypothetical protein
VYVLNSAYSCCIAAISAARDVKLVTE